jgi:hypothetical protein
MKPIFLLCCLLLPVMALGKEPANVVVSAVALDKQVPAVISGKDKSDKLEFALRFVARRDPAYIVLYGSMSFQLVDARGAEVAGTYARPSSGPASRSDVLWLVPESVESAIFCVIKSETERGTTLVVPDRSGGSYFFWNVKPGTYALQMRYSYPTDDDFISIHKFDQVPDFHEQIERGPISCGSFKFTLAK